MLLTPKLIGSLAELLPQAEFLPDKDVAKITKYAYIPETGDVVFRCIQSYDEEILTDSDPVIYLDFAKGPVLYHWMPAKIYEDGLVLLQVQFLISRKINKKRSIVAEKEMNDNWMMLFDYKRLKTNLSLQKKSILQDHDILTVWDMSD